MEKSSLIAELSEEDDRRMAVSLIAAAEQAEEVEIIWQTDLPQRIPDAPAD